MYNVYSEASYKRADSITTIGVAHMINGTVYDWDCFKSNKVYSSVNEEESSAVLEAARSVIYFSKNLFIFIVICYRI